MRNFEILPETLNNSRWKTYLWILVIASIFSVFFNIQLLEFSFKLSERFFSDYLPILIVSIIFLIVAWIFWILFFGLNYLRIKNISYYDKYDEEDTEYIIRKFSRYYRLFDLLIALHFISLLISIVSLFINLLRF